MNRYDLINKLIKKHNYTRYLEIGLDTGHNFSKVECDIKESVDPAEGAYAHATPTYKMTSDLFFESKAPSLEKWDIIFIDGLHHSEQVDLDIQNSLKYLNANGSIILHDCNPLSELAQRVPRESSRWNGDVWKSIVKYRASASNMGCVVINSDEGLGWIHQDLPTGDSFDVDYTYESLSKNRELYLGLITVSNANTLLK